MCEFSLGDNTRPAIYFINMPNLYLSICDWLDTLLLKMHRPIIISWTIIIIMASLFSRDTSPSHQGDNVTVIAFTSNGLLLLPNLPCVIAILCQIYIKLDVNLCIYEASVPKYGNTSLLAKATYTPMICSIRKNSERERLSKNIKEQNVFSESQFKKPRKIRVSFNNRGLCACYIGIILCIRNVGMTLGLHKH